MSALTDLTIASACAGLEGREFSARELTEAHIAAAEAARELNHAGVRNLRPGAGARGRGGQAPGSG